MAIVQITDQEQTISDEALQAFDTYAGIKLEDDISDYPPLRKMQIEHHRWQVTKLSNSADTSLAVMALGVVEEACWEMPMAVEADARDEQYDTLGDILIYTCAACTDLRIDFMVLSKNFDPVHLVQPEGLDGLMNLYKGVGMLAHVVGKTRQLTRGYDRTIVGIVKTRIHAGAAIQRICSAVQWMCFANDWDASVLFQEVLTRVMKRDWTKNAMNGDAIIDHTSSAT